MLLSNPYTHDARVRQEVRSLTRAGYSVTVLCWDRQGNFPRREQLDDATIRRQHIPSRPGSGLRQTPRMVTFWVLVAFRAMRYHFDCIHCHDFDTLPPAVLVGALSRKPVIYDAHESYPDTLSDRVPRVGIWLVATVEKMLLRGVDVVIASGFRLAESLRQRGARRVYVVGNWKAKEDFAIDPGVLREWRRELGLDKYALCIAYLGVLMPSRSILPLLDAAAACPEVAVLIGGYGPLEAEVARRAQTLANVTYLGNVPAADVPLYTMLADVVYYCLSLDYPGGYFSSPNKLFEALAAGKALIATRNIGEIGEIVERMDCGILVTEPSPAEIKQAVERLMVTDLLARLQANAGAAFEEQYNWAQAEETLLTVYRRCVPSSS